MSGGGGLPSVAQCGASQRRRGRPSGRIDQRWVAHRLRQTNGGSATATGVSHQICRRAVRQPRFPVSGRWIARRCRWSPVSRCAPPQPQGGTSCAFSAAENFRELSVTQQVTIDRPGSVRVVAALVDEDDEVGPGALPAEVPLVDACNVHGGNCRWMSDRSSVLSGWLRVNNFMRSISRVSRSRAG